ncbi:MAG: translational GTPase TypA [Saccharofermentanaceae bacterium]|jgi:GTP-binding protein|nr:translational GTPase TypA [Clostridia bacterium]NLX68162.1 translational GTPase TypA [Clostridiaceae bacterium]HOO48941.1 translational GTPase TypA [Saccharofermentans sp.]HPE27648.1 translational GTPase TypA [Saccharofermentans sp.]HPJ81306.1 translational GTPase TypA [Saccharofermentans sp.]
MTKIENMRNVAIIAHVDHGKTTIVDSMLKQAGIYRENEQIVEQVMDSNDLERERGITILAKNTAIQYGDIRINVVDTPGHADFGGEVERVLKMVDSVLLVVDSYDGPMPQTRFVLRKALELGLKPIVCINKIDRPDARPVEVVDMVLDLFVELGADDDQLEFPIVYTSGKTGVATLDIKEFQSGAELDFSPLLDTVVKYTPCIEGDTEGPMQLLVSNIDSDPYIGRIAIGRVERGTIKKGESVAIVTYGEDTKRTSRVVKLLRFQGLGKQEVESAGVGEIVCVAGIVDINIGDTICDSSTPEAIPFVDIDEPTISMTFSVNDSPFAGQEGKFVTSRHLRDRLFKEMETNVSMRLEETDTTEAFIVKGRGELHLSILIETMRREGYEFQVSRPHVIMKEIGGVLCEPVEDLVVDVPEEFVGPVIEKLGRRKAEMTNMLPPTKGYTRLEFNVPSRGIIGYRTEFLTDTKGNGIMNSVISGFQPFAGEIETRSSGVLVAFESGDAMTYGLFNAQGRGSLMIGAGVPVYEGMIVGINPKPEDIAVNVCKKKHVTNMRASGSDDAMRLVPPINFSLEQCLEFVEDDELCEVTPKNIRLRKRILSTDLRAKSKAAKKKE